MYQYLRHYLLVFTLFFIAGEAYSTDIILTDSVKHIRTTGMYSRIFEDTTAALSFSEVKKLALEKKFIQLEVDLPRNEHSKSSYWLMFNVKNKASEGRQWVLEMPDPRINDVKIFVCQEGGCKEVLQGNLKSFGNKLYNHKNFHVKLPFDQSDEITVFLRFQSSYEVGMASIVHDMDHFLSYAISEYFILGLFYGLILLMAIYNIFMFLMIREKTYLFYVFYAISVGLLLMTYDGTGFQFVWPNSPRFNLYSYIFFSYTMVLFAILFTRSFLKLKENSPILSRTLQYAIYIRTLLFILGLILKVDQMLFYYLDASILGMAYVSGIASLKKGNNAAKFLVLAYSLLFAGYLITVLKEFRILPNNIFTVYAFNFGVILEIAFLSLAMADRLKHEILEKDHAKGEKIKELKKNELLQQELLKEVSEKEKERARINKELEEMVLARTRELNVANSKLQVQAVEINRMNIQLDHDNRKLQKNLSSVERARITNKPVNYDEFILVYPDDYSCMEYLSELKWSKDYSCQKCGNSTYGKGKEIFARRCKKCGYNESVTAFTLFHKLKFPLKKAFYLLFLVNSKEGKITVDELSEQLQLRRNTCWNFKKKIEEKVEANKSLKKPYKYWENLILNE